ncbi:MAG TPA: SsrA-binding protein SmpB [Alphaproteobacteria bacterium]|nr:SsrA-binding protein SmpB [Alphaproteobacteria bacterium]
MTPTRIAAQNRRARHDYFIEETVEAGIVLAGSEVKALREGRGNLNDAYAGPSEGALWLFNAYIPEYRAANRFNHETRRPRKLLLHKRQADRLSGLVQREGATLVPLAVYFNERGIAKVELGLARGKRKADKRAAEREREWQRSKARILRARG